MGAATVVLLYISFSIPALIFLFTLTYFQCKENARLKNDLSAIKEGEAERRIYLADKTDQLRHKKTEVYNLYNSKEKLALMGTRTHDLIEEALGRLEDVRTRLECARKTIDLHLSEEEMLRVRKNTASSSGNQNAV